MEDLLAWATAQGARTHKLTPQDRAFLVTEDVKAGDTLIAVPQAILLHAEVALQDREYGPAFRQLAAELGPGVDSRHLLCVLLVLEKARGQASSWAPYISILPEAYDDPYWWTDDQIALVKGTRLGRAIATHYPGLQQISASIQRLEQFFSASQPPGSPACVLRTYRNGWALGLHAARWARSTVWSRSFTVRMLANGTRNVVAMVPVLDMIDHNPSMEVVWHTGPDGQEPFQFMPLGDTCKGTIMANNYGQKPSDELLLAYGFLLDGPNPADRLVVSLAHRRLGGPQQAGSGSPAGQQGTGTSGANHVHLPSARLGGVGRGSDDDASGDEELAAQQQAAEDVQRNFALMSLGLSVDQQLSVADPLPSSLLLGAQLCLLPPPQLYLWAAQLQNARRSPFTRPPSRACSLSGGPSTASVAPVLLPPAQPSGPDGADQEMGEAGSRGSAGSTGGAAQNAAGRKRAWQSSHGGTPREPAPVQQPSTAPRDPHVTALLTADSAMHIAASVGGGCSNHHSNSSPSGRLDGVGAALGNGVGMPVGSPSMVGAGTGVPLQIQGPPVHITHRLQALVSMKQQLQSRVAAMASEQQTQAARIHATMADAAPASGQGRAANGHAGMPAGLPSHSRLALRYLDLQQDLIRCSMAAVADQVSAQVHAASALLRTCAQQRLITCRVLTAGRGPAYLPSPTPASAQGSGDQACGPRTAPPTWSCIDADLHVHQYTMWLRSWGLLPPGAPAQEDGSALLSPMEVDGVGPPVGVQGPGTCAGGQDNGVGSRQGGCCVLQETVHTRSAAPQFLARRSSRETLVQPDQPPGVVGAGGGGPGKPAGNGRARGPPSSSRTFTMKGAKPSALAPGLASHDAAASPAPAAGAGAVPATATPTAAPLKRVSMPQGMGVSLGVDSDYDPVALGVTLARGVQAGSPALHVPLECCLVARSQQGLLATLMTSAYSLLLALVASVRPYIISHAVAAPGTAGSMATATVPMTNTHDMLVWHLLHTVAAPATARLYASDVEGVQLLAEMLEDSPAAGSFQEALEGLKTEFTTTRKALAVAGVTRTAKDGLLLKALSGPNAPNLYFWAKHVVDRCAVQVPLPGTAAAAGGEAGPGQSVWVVAPVLAAVCPELRDALFAPELQLPDSAAAAASAAAVTSGDVPVPRAVSGSALILRAACELSLGVHLSPLMLLPGLDTEELMTCWGPEALPWQQLLHMSAAATARRALQRSTSGLSAYGSGGGGTAGGGSDASTGGEGSAPSSGLPPLAVNGGPGGNGSAGNGFVPAGSDSLQLPAAPASLDSTGNALAHAATVLHSRTVLYELYCCPGERDPLCAAKLRLLTASGLGSVHYLSIDSATEHLIMCALKICLAGKDLLQHPLAQQCVRLYDAATTPTPHASDVGGAGAGLLRTGSGSGGASSAGSDAAGAAGGSGGAPTGSVSPADSQAYQQLHAVQPQLLDMLSSLPDDLPVCKAARKQLRQMVHDARKNTRRRLKQLEAVHNVVAHHVSGSGGGGSGSPANGLRAAAAQIVSALGGSYHPLGGSAAMHEGVRLYLSGLCDVLDTWADHLGLNRQSDSMSKRHKTRHEDV